MQPNQLSLGVRDAASLLGVSASTLNRLRLYQPERSPPFVRLGNRVVYPIEKLRTWLADGASQAGGTR